MKYAHWARLLLAAWLIGSWAVGSGAAQARPGGPGSDTPPPATGPRNVAFGKPVFLSTNGVAAPMPGFPTAAFDAPAVTDGTLNPAPGEAGGPGGGLLFYNPLLGRTLAVTITIDLQGSYNVTSIRYNPGNGAAAAALPDTISTPLGSSTPPPADGPEGAWTTQTGHYKGETVTVVLHQTRGLAALGVLAVGEIEVYGTGALPQETLKLPFDPGHEWRITQGYHGDTSHNQWERAYVCGMDYLAFDLARVDFRTEEDHVRAAASGRIQVIWPALGAVMIRHDWPSGVYFTSYYHMNPLNPDLKLGQWVAQGTVLGRPGAQGLTAEAGVHIHWSLYRAPDPALIPQPAVEAGTPNWCRDPVRWVESVPFLHVEAAGRGLIDFTDDPAFGEPCGCEGMYAEKRYISTQPEIGTVPPAADVPGLRAGDPYTTTTGALAFPATAHTLAAPFRAFWEAHGGADVLGMPETEAYWERDSTGLHQVQAFERVIVRHYPQQAGMTGEWSLDRLGSALMGGLHRLTEAWHPVPAFETTDRQRFFPETGHGVYGAFYRQWQATGGLQWWGYPISEPLYEASPLSGQTYLTQYFERARLEYHPESKGTAAEIRANRLGLLGLIGRGWIAP